MTKLTVELGKILVSVDQQVVGTAENLVLTVVEADPEEIRRLEEAKFIVLVRPGKATPPEKVAAGPLVPVSRQRFGEVLQGNENNDYVLPLKGWEVGILHGLIALSADHPQVKSMSKATQDTIRHVRDWCMAVLIDWGFSPEEALYLDVMREDRYGKLSREEDGTSV